MALYRHARPRDSFHLLTCNGPVVVKVKNGRAGIEVDAPKAVKISFEKRKSKLTKQRKGG